MPFLYPDHKPIIRHPTGHPVAVIASFKSNGDFIPLYFCIEDDNEELFKYKISAIKAIKDNHGVKIFECSFTAYGYQNIILLILDFVLCRWTVGCDKF